MKKICLSLSKRFGILLLFLIITAVFCDCSTYAKGKFIELNFSQQDNNQPVVLNENEKFFPDGTYSNDFKCYNSAKNYNIKEHKNRVIIIPSTSSERRNYILNQDSSITNSALAIYYAEPWGFGVVTSRMHMVWVRAVAGKLETRLRYLAELCYNTFLFSDITDKQKKNIEYYINNILAEREKYSDKTMAELYDPDKMPQRLKEAHHSLDIVIEKCYRSTPFESEERRLEYLFKCYEIMTNQDKKLSSEEQLSLL